MKFKTLLIFFALLFGFNSNMSGIAPPNEELTSMPQETIECLLYSAEIEHFYDLKDNEQIKEITSNLLNSNAITNEIKQNIISSGRRVFVFWYPSDGLKIKGYISFTPTVENNPVLVYLRGGNRKYAMPNPGSDIATYKNYTVISATYRGGVSEGNDEYGGADVNDVHALVQFIPQLTSMLNIHLKANHSYLLGASRGGMEMFLALSQFPELQNYFDKVISLSAIIDFKTQIENRPEMKSMLKEDFGLIPEVNESEWISKRSPLLTIPKLNKSLPILLIQGTEDDRVSLNEGRQMVQKLQQNENNVTYIEVKGGDHSLYNNPKRMNIIGEWIESPQS